MNLTEEFEKDLWRTVEVARDHDYIPTYFIRMLQELGGVETAKRLLSKSEPQTGLFELYHKHLLHESMEAVVLQEKYHALFTSNELSEARHRLEELGYFSK